jgi:subtilisin family serine protease
MVAKGAEEYYVYYGNLSAANTSLQPSDLYYHTTDYESMDEDDYYAWYSNQAKVWGITATGTEIYSDIDNNSYKIDFPNNETFDFYNSRNRTYAYSLISVKDRKPIRKTCCDYITSRFSFYALFSGKSYAVCFLLFTYICWQSLNVCVLEWPPDI